MNKYIRILLVLSIILTFVPSVLFAQEHTYGDPDAVTSATPKLKADEVVITGKIICLGCSLKEEKDAKAQCSIYGHINALQIEKIIDAQGKSIEAAKGKIYQFLHNGQSDKLIKDHTYLSKIIVITGKIYPEANIVEVRFFKEKQRR